jgi:hypothetical protein
MSLTLTIKAVWLWEKGTGDPCMVCGDRNFLSQRRLFASIEGHDANDELQPLDQVLCKEHGLAICE